MKYHIGKSLIQEKTFFPFKYRYIFCFLILQFTATSEATTGRLIKNAQEKLVEKIKAEIELAEKYKSELVDLYERQEPAIPSIRNLTVTDSLKALNESAIVASF